TSKWLTHQIDDMRIRLERSEDTLQAYASRAGLMFTAEKNSVSEERLRQIQTSLSSAQTDRISKQSRWEMASASPKEQLGEILGDATLRDYESKAMELQRQLAELRSRLEDKHSKVQEVLTKLQEIQQPLQRTRNDALAKVKNEYDEAVRRESLITAD